MARARPCGTTSRMDAADAQSGTRGRCAATHRADAEQLAPPVRMQPIPPIDKALKLRQRDPTVSSHTRTSCQHPRPRLACTQRVRTRRVLRHGVVGATLAAVPPILPLSFASPPTLLVGHGHAATSCSRHACMRQLWRAAAGCAISKRCPAELIFNSRRLSKIQSNRPSGSVDSEVHGFQPPAQSCTLRRVCLALHARIVCELVVRGVVC